MTTCLPRDRNHKITDFIFHRKLITVFPLSLESRDLYGCFDVSYAEIDVQYPRQLDKMPLATRVAAPCDIASSILNIYSLQVHSYTYYIQRLHLPPSLSIKSIPALKLHHILVLLLILNFHLPPPPLCLFLGGFPLLLFEL